MTRAVRILLGGLAGALPGAVLVLLTLPVSGEAELTLGVAGLFLGVAGLVGGLAGAASRTAKTRS